MKPLLNLLALLALATIPAFGNSIPPPPILSIALPSLACDMGASNFGCDSGSSQTGITNNFVLVLLGGFNFLHGNVTGDTFTGSTTTGGTFAGTFSAYEFVVGSDRGVYEYAVSGTFSILWNGVGSTANTAQINIPVTDVTFIGRVGVTPEPATLAMMGTGLCGIACVLRRRLKRVDRNNW